MLLYINVAIWVNFETTCAILRVLAARLKDELMKLQLSYIPSHYTFLKVMLQVYLIGAYTACNLADRA